MKPITSKLVFASVTLTLVFLIASSFGTDMTGYKYATMYATETTVGPLAGFDYEIVIIYEDDKIEKIPLEKNNNAGTFLSNKVKINRTLNNMATKGYELICSNGNMYTFLKK